MAKRTSFDPSRAYTYRVDESTPSGDKWGLKMEDVFGAELRLTADEIQSMLIGCLAVAVAIVVFGVALAL